MLITALALALNSPIAAPPKPVRASDDPPIRVWTNDDNYQPGDRATVKFQLSDDGYVIVLRADTRGHLRVLFPLDPGADNFIKGGRTFEIRARGDRDAFQVDDQSGTGTIFAAVSDQPFTFSSYVLGDHWDYKALDNEDLGSDPEAAMVDLVHGMAGPNHYEYDVTTYTVSSQVAYSDGGGYYAPSYYPAYYPCWGCGPWYGGSGVFVNFRFGYPYYGGFYDSCFYDPFFCDGFGVPFYGAYYGYYARPYYGYGYFHPRYAGFYPGVYHPFAGTYRPPFSSPRTPVPSVGVRNRWAGSGGVPFARGGRTAAPNGSEPGRRGGSFGGAVEPRSRPAPAARPNSPPPDRGRGSQPEPRRGRDGRDSRGGRGNNDQSFTRPNQPIRQEPMRPAPRSEPRPEYRPAPRMESRPAPRMESRPAPSPSRGFSMPSAPRGGGGGFSAPAPRSGGGGGGGGRGRHGR